MVLWKQQISCSGSPHSPISLYLLGISFQELVFPYLPHRGLKGLPHPQCAHFRTNMAQVPSLALSPPAARMKQPALGQDCVTWGQPPLCAHLWGAEGPLALLTREMDTRHWMHVAECALRAAQRATTSCSDSDTNKESCAHKNLLQL